MNQNNALQRSQLIISIIYLPVFLFAISQTQNINWLNTALFFVIMFALVHPSIRMQITYANMQLSKCEIAQTEQAKKLFKTSTAMDGLAVILSAIILSLEVGAGVLTYLLLSKLHNSNPIRLKKYAIISWLLTMFIHGVLLFALTQYACGKIMLITYVFALQASAFFVGFAYPLIQMYTHIEDANRGDLTMSLRLGIKGTFTLSLVLFLVAISFMGLHFYNTNHLFHFYLFLLFLSPVAAYFFWWRKNTKIQPMAANYTFTRLFMIITTICMGLYALVLIYLNHLG
jgi:1,4-dihydroxy-2-naphthoate octaprenyltransferase